ncbi:MAG: CYTH domain-containing protein [Firmicutes bacterium]|nr:CYTH domain-containing protein [Bacillota bacterium]
MEIEVKYELPSEEEIEKILNDEYLTVLSDPKDTETVPLRAVYCDTAEGDLRKKKISLRVRAEGPTAFATAKWAGSSDGAVHRREEVNIPIEIEKASDVPDAELFEETPIGAELKAVTERSPLIPVLIMQFDRTRRKLVFEDNIIELALDRGKIITPRGCCPILEMELEHFAGPDPLAVLELGEVLAERHSLLLQPLSKYERGLMLLKAGTEDQ